MTFHDVDQNTDEWLALRCGKITGSAIGKVMANEGKAFGEPAKNYAIQIAIERITGRHAESSYSNAHMERGHEQEPLARMAYEDEFFCEVSNGGFFECGNEGCSPDGRVYDDGLIEIKSVIPSVHYQTIKRGSFDPKYKWQLYFALKTTGRAWIDFVSYCHDFPSGKKLYVHRIYAKEYLGFFGSLNKRIGEFEELISEITNNIMKG